MNKLVYVLLALLLVSMSAIVLLIFGTPPRVRFATGKAGQSFHAYGKTIEEACLPDISFDVRTESNGAKANATDLNRGLADIGLVHRELPESRSLLALANLYRSPVQVLARRDSGIFKIADITAETRVILGPDGSGTKYFAQKILDAYGSTYVRTPVGSWDEEFELLARGEADVAFVCMPIPTERISKMDNKGDYTFLSLQKTRVNTEASELKLSSFSISADAYEDGLPNQETETVAIVTTLAVGPHFTSTRTIEKITRLIFENANEFPNGAEGVRGADHEFAKDSTVLRIHPGARRFYDNPKGMNFTERAAIGAAWLGLIGGVLGILKVFGALKFLERFFKRSQQV